MNKVESNSQEQANKSLEKYDGAKVPSEINENESHLYHVAIMESSFNRAELKVEHKMSIQMFADRAWLRVVKNLPRIGISNAFIFHNPTLGDAKVVEAPQTKVDEYDSLKEEAIELGFVDGGKKASKTALVKFIADAKLKGVKTKEELAAIEEERIAEEEAAAEAAKKEKK